MYVTKKTVVNRKLLNFRKKNEDKTSRQTEVSDYFVVRRSGRKCKSVIEVCRFPPLSKLKL